MKITDIQLNPGNPRLIKDDKFKKLCQSIKDFPRMMELRPIIIDDDGIILGGNMRYQALKRLGYTDVPDEWVKRASELTEDQKREFIVKDNVGFGEWDWDMLANEFDADLLEQWGLDVPEMEGPEELPEAKEDDYEIPSKIDTDIVPGDLIEIGHHRLICGDSTSTDTYEKLFQGETADLIVTDPPYNVNYTGGTDEKLKIANDNMNSEDFFSFLLDSFSAAASFLKAGGAVYVWHADNEGISFRRALIENGIDLKQCLIWVKNSMVIGRQDYQWRHEPCLYGWKSGAAHYFTDDRTNTTVIDDKVDLKKLSKPEMLKMLQDIFSEKTSTSIIYCDKPSKNDVHPTMKPVQLIAHLIGNSSKKGQIVADGFGGSGTTMVAAHQLGRKAYLVELDPKYCQVIVDRMINLDPSIEVKRNGQPWRQVARKAG
ncbi:MAG: DNA modification methylase [Chlorobiaceae bacterium]|nr:DNA modification methylase [Chlorobiaceae bacterium]